jgi:hypothetical protein
MRRSTVLFPAISPLVQAVVAAARQIGSDWGTPGQIPRPHQAEAPSHQTGGCPLKFTSRLSGTEYQLSRYLTDTHPK